jgi:hypothetical protein
MMLAISPKDTSITWGCGFVPIRFANMGEAERRRAAESAKLRIDLFTVKLLRAQRCAVTG